MSRDLRVKYDVERYRPLGLLSNPFSMAENGVAFNATELETASEANRLLGVVMAASQDETARPIAVIKPDDIPDAYCLRAVGLVERSLATDEGVNLLHAYIPLFLMRLGRVRSILSVVAERLAFRDFDTTLATYIEHVIAEPDTELTSYQLLGEDGLAAFAERFSADPIGTTKAMFGEEELERHPELRDVADPRADDLPSDVDEDDTDPELDSTVGDAPANAFLMAAADEDTEVEDADRAVVDYIVEYAKAHYSPVIARGLRVYRERGQMGLVNELKVTKAPKKTLAALVKFARIRFKKVVLIFDGFSAWYGVPADLKAQIAASLSEVRWLLERDGIMVFALEKDRVPELEEQFGHGTRAEWAFGSLVESKERGDSLDLSIIDTWLARAAYPGAEPLSATNPVLAELAGTATGLAEFAMRASTAIESAAERGVAVLDEEALGEAKAVTSVEATKE